MEPKKSPKADIHSKRNVIFNFSLFLSLLIVICAFKVVAPVRTIHLPDNGIPDVDLLYIPPVTNIKTEKPTDPPKPKKIIPNPESFREVKEITVATLPVPALDVESAPETNTTLAIETPPAEKVDSIFRIVEKMPVPVGGYEAFFHTLRKNIKYPAQARRMGTEGKVYVEFTVNEKGELDNVHTITGIGSGCNEEAIRVLKLTKWEPGKQRGRAVKVRMVQQVNFRLAR
jgi:protein TonB